jgi:hypothetical protein
VVEVYEGVLRPQTVPKFVPADHLPRPLQKKFENPEGLFLELDSSPVPA